MWGQQLVPIVVPPPVTLHKGGKGLTVTTTEVVQPPLLNVIVDVPGDTPDIVLHRDAPGGTLTLLLSLDQLPDPGSQSVIALPTQTQSGAGPVMAGNVLTVIVVETIARPQAVLTEYTMTCTPGVAPAVKIRLLNVP